MSDAGTAYIDVLADTAKASKDIEKDIGRAAGKAGKDVESKLGGAFKAVAGIAGGIFAGAQVVGFGKDMLTLGTQIETFGRKAKTVFEGSTDDVTTWAKANASSFGLTDDSLRGLAANFGDLLKPMGFTAAQAAKMSTEVVGLSGALSAWSGGQRTAAQVSDILAKAMLGERDSLKELGISISQADVDLRLFEKGQKSLTGAAKEQAEAIATQELIFEKSADAQKAWADGSMDAVKKQNALKEKIGELKEDLANKLRPAFAAAIGYLVDTAIPGLERFGASLNMAPKLQELTGGVRAFAAAFKANDGDVTSSGFAGFMEKLGFEVRKLADSLRSVDWSKIREGLAGVDWSNLGVGMSVAGAAIRLIADNADTLIRFLPLIAAGWVAVNVAQGLNNTIGRDSVIGMALQVGSTLSLAASNRTLATAMGSVTVAAGTQTAAMGVGTAAVGGMSLAAAGAATAVGVALAGALVLLARTVDDKVPVLRKVDETFISWERKIPVVGEWLARLDEKVLGLGNSSDTASGQAKNLTRSLEQVSGDWLARIELDTSGAEAKIRALQSKMDALGVQGSARSLAADSGDISGPISRSPAVSESAPSAPSDDGGASQEFALGMEKGPVKGRPGSKVPIIAHAGEWVLTPEQMAGLRSGRSGGSTAGASAGAGITAAEIGAAVAAALAANPSRSYVVASDLARGLSRMGPR